MTATLSNPQVTIPIFADDDGTLRVGQSRFPLDTIISHYRQGQTPEDIVESFDVLRLADVYAVIAYYLDHQVEVEKYLARREREADEIRKQIEAMQPPRSNLRDVLLDRWLQKFGKPYPEQ